MKHALIVASTFIALAAGLPYIIDTLKGKTHPNLVTWLTWSLVNIINTLALYSSGSIPAAVLATANTLITGIIFIAGLRRGVRKYSPLDIGCQALALTGIIAWRTANDPVLAIAVAQAVLIIAAVPTWRHAWREPLAETWEGFGLTIVAGSLTLLSLNSHNFASLVSPLVYTGNGIIMVSIIIGRRRSLAPPPSAPTGRA